MQEHFKRLAPDYNALRTTDSSPVEYISNALPGYQSLHCADVGCGSGRYDLLLLRIIPSLQLVCCDVNQAMLDETDSYLEHHGESRYSLQLADAAAFTAPDGKFDFITSFNAIHHFDPVEFLGHAADLLTPGGQIFIYTRLPAQNENTIWGRYFPGFIENESRLYGPGDIEKWTHCFDQIHKRHIEQFSYRRRSSLQQLVDLATNRHYSTFEFYSDEELEIAINQFHQRIVDNFADENFIEWVDANIMIEFRSSI